MKYHPLLSIQARTQTLILRYFKYTPYYFYMKRIHNSHLGESCFIIGNGPSLTIEDLNSIHEHGIDSFAVNRIYNIFPQTEWRPTYYVSSDVVMIRDHLSEVNAIPIKHKFIPLQNKYDHAINVKKAHYFFRSDRKENEPPEIFSLDVSDKVHMMGTVTIDCIQLAIHMGYRNIYLLGIDHNFDKIITENGEIVIDPSAKNYFCDGYDDDVAHEVCHNIGYTTKSYMAIQHFCLENNINVYNASRKTKLTVFPKVDFDHVMRGFINAAI